MGMQMVLCHLEPSPFYLLACSFPSPEPQAVGSARAKHAFC